MEPSSSSRKIAIFNSALNFALALSLSNLVDNRKVISFLQLPSANIDPSLAFLALGALPVAVALNAFFRRQKDIPVLGGPWRIPKGGPIDLKLLSGAALFGVGWGSSGMCRMCFPISKNAYSHRTPAGPGLVNLGRSLITGTNILPYATWVAATVIGGLFI